MEGGVKALLSKIQEKFPDSHVQLPDGTIPSAKNKLGAGKNPKADASSGIKPKDSATGSEGQHQQTAATTGVKAKLAEINSKFANSFIKLPDGSVPRSLTPNKKPNTDAKRIEDQVETLPTSISYTEAAKASSSREKTADETIISDYPASKANVGQNGQQKNVMPDHRSFQDLTDFRIQTSSTRVIAGDSGYPAHLSTGWMGGINAVPFHVSPAHNMYNPPPPPLLDRSKQSNKTAQKPAAEMQPNSSATGKNQSKPVNSFSEPSSVISTTLAYGIGISFKPDDQGHMKVVNLIPGGAGAESGRIQIGDWLRSVDDINVAQLSWERFAELVSGPSGSTVKLTLIRQRDNAANLLFEVSLTRGPSEKPSIGNIAPRVLVPKVIAVKPIPVVAKGAKDIGSSSGHLVQGAEIDQPRPNNPLPHHVMSSPAASHERGPSVRESNQFWRSPERTIHNDQPIQQTSFHREQSSDRAAQREPPTQSATQRSQSDERAGVGIVFHKDDSGRLRIKRLATGNPAQHSGSLLAGDVLIEIDGVDPFGKSPLEIQDAIMGPEGSTVTLGFGRERPNQQSTIHRVLMTRFADVSAQGTSPVGSVNYSLPVSNQGNSPAKLLDMLFLGDDVVSKNREGLRNAGITCIINAARECPCLFEREFAYTRMQFEDSPTENIRKGFDQVSAIISKNMLQGLSSLVHCSASLSRSSALCIAFLMKEKKATLRQAFHLIKAAKPTMKLNYGFYLQLVDYERDLFGPNTMNAVSEEEYLRMLQAFYRP